MQSSIANNQSNPTKRGINLRGLLQVCIGVGALALLIYKSDTRNLLEAIKMTRISLLPLAILATVCVNWLMAYRWGVILRTRNHTIKTSHLFRYYLIGIFFMNFVPGGGVGGDVARLVYADREVRDKPYVLSSLIYERLVGLFVLLFLGFLATIASHGQLPESRTFYFGESALALALIGSMAMMSEALSSKLAKLARWCGAKFKLERFGSALARTFEAVSKLKSHKKMLMATVLLSILIRIVWGIGCFVAALAMNIPINFFVLFSFISLVDMIRMLPTWGGGIGVREWALVALFGSIGIGREQALMFSFLAFAPILLNAIVGGILYTSSAGLMKRELQIASKQVEA